MGKFLKHFVYNINKIIQHFLTLHVGNNVTSGKSLTEILIQRSQRDLVHLQQYFFLPWKWDSFSDTDVPHSSDSDDNRDALRMYSHFSVEAVKTTKGNKRAISGPPFHNIGV